MTTVSDVGPRHRAPLPAAGTGHVGGDRRGSWIPTGAMITTQFMELRKRRVA